MWFEERRVLDVAGVDLPLEVQLGLLVPPPFLLTVRQFLDHLVLVSVTSSPSTVSSSSFL